MPETTLWKGPGRGASKHYATLTIEQIAELPVPDLADTDCHLWIWFTNSFGKAAHKLMETWGFEEKTILTWRKVTNDRQKQRIGMGRYLRNSTEHCLFGVRGRLPSEGPKDIPSCFDAPRGLHSRKPDEAYEIIRAISPGPRLSMFAREQRAGFDLWGNEAMGEDAA